jgi:hypothetical protein
VGVRVRAESRSQVSVEGIEGSNEECSSSHDEQSPRHSLLELVDAVVKKVGEAAVSR